MQRFHRSPRRASGAIWRRLRALASTRALLGALGAADPAATQRPGSSEASADVVDQLDVGVLVADLEGRIVRANPAAIELVELGELSGQPMSQALAALQQRPDKVIETRAIALNGPDGATGHALILTDRTEAERARRRLELGGRLEALGSLTAGIAHEVNNPLAFIQSNLSVLEDTAKSLREPEVRVGWSPGLEEAVDDMGALLEETREGLERIRDLVARLKSFARTPDLEATPVEVHLDRAIRQAAAIATLGHAHDIIRIEGGAGFRVTSIETAVFQILVNLLLNAVQAAEAEPEVRVHVGPEDGGVLIQVEDHGPGIATHLLPRIFDPFFTTKPTGTGLGLSLSYDLARRLGGHLSAANREVGGACFTLWLPAELPAREESADAAAPTTT
jgi:two-component system NtrC family sensor kinase